MISLIFTASLTIVAASLTIVTASLGPMGADAPAREPQMVARGSRVFLAFGAGNRIYVSSSTDSGKNFAAPVKVAEASILPLTRHRGPRIAISGSALVITAVTGKTPTQGAHAHGLPADGDLLAWRSLDDGKTWSKGVPVNDVPAAATEGLHTLAADAKGHLFAAWLDKRTGQGTQLYGARSDDQGVTWQKNALIYNSPDGSICECCHPSAAFDADGQVVVMWRNELAGARDMYLARSRDAKTFSTPEKLGRGSWQLNGCPMDGGGLVLTEKGLVTAWRRNKEIFVASPGEPETPVGEGADVSLAGGRRGVYAVWSSPVGIQTLSPGQRKPVVLAPPGAFPSVVNLSTGAALAAWECDGKIVVQPIP
jgi:hypothetical protein